MNNKDKKAEIRKIWDAKNECLRFEPDICTLCERIRQTVELLDTFAKEAVEEADGETYRAVRKLSEIMDKTIVTPDMKKTAAMHVEAYQRQKESEYVYSLLQEIKRLRDSIAQAHALGRQEGYEAGIHETAIKVDKEMASSLRSGEATNLLRAEYERGRQEREDEIVGKMKWILGYVSIEPYSAWNNHAGDEEGYHCKGCNGEFISHWPRWEKPTIKTFPHEENCAYIKATDFLASLHPPEGEDMK